jgi:hypothetical protein
MAAEMAALHRTKNGSVSPGCVMISSARALEKCWQFE